MKKTALRIALWTLTLPASVYALGLGAMTLKSALDQPFYAEIELIDPQSVSLKEIKIGVADPENFNEIGLERTAVLSLLSFKIEKNEYNKEVIKVYSTERISDPYLELVVDLIWPQGQLYKAYTVLLDPSGYHLGSSTIKGGIIHYKQKQSVGYSEPGVINKPVTSMNYNSSISNDSKSSSTYGPTVANESIWQIAQRYKTSEVILPQVVLAIVGANPQAFIDDNLNGLKTGEKLSIPSTADILKVPSDLATSEVMSHDKAWTEKTWIAHVIPPPYTNTQESKSLALTRDDSLLPVIHIDKEASLIPTMENSLMRLTPLANVEQNSAEKTELSITASAVESIREANAGLIEQLRLVQKQNTSLQKQISLSTKELKKLRSQVLVLTQQRNDLADQQTVEAHRSLLWSLLLLLLGTGGGMLSFWYYHRQSTNKGATVKVPSDHSLIVSDISASKTVSAPFSAMVPVEVTVSAEETVPVEKTVPVEEMNILKQTDDALSFDSPQSSKESQPIKNTIEEILEPLVFESGLYHSIDEEKEEKKESDLNSKMEENNAIEFTFNSISTEQSANETSVLKPTNTLMTDKTIDLNEDISQFFIEEKSTSDAANNLLKSQKALDTLLALAKSYISMNDFESARHSLEEVIEFGTPQQKQEANALLKSIDQ